MREIIRHSRFGHLMESNIHFRRMFQHFAAESSDPMVAALRKRLSIEVGADGEVMFKSKDLNYTYRRNPGENFEQFHRRILMGGTSAPGAIDIFNPTEGLPIDMVRSAEIITGERLTADNVADLQLGQRAGFRRRLEADARRSNVTIRYRTFEGGVDSLTRINEAVGYDQTGNVLGLVLPSDDKTSVIEMFDRSNRKLTLEEIYDVHGIDPKNQGAFFKRMNAFVNRTVIGKDYAPGEVKVAMFDPTDFFGKDKHLDQQVRETVSRSNFLRERFSKETFKRQGFGQGTLDNAEEIRRIQELMADGQSVMPRSQYNEIIKSMGEEVSMLDARVNELTDLGATGRGPAGEAELAKAKRDLAALRKQVSDTRAAVDNGASFNIRVIGASDILGQDKSSKFFKGDTLVVSDNQYVQIVRRSTAHSGLSRAKILSTQIFAAATDAKDELGIKRGVHGYISLAEQAKPKVAWSNALTAANFGHLFNPPGEGTGGSFLERSLSRTITDYMDDIKGGKIPSGLLDIIKGYEDITPDLFETTAEYTEALRTQTYARRLKEFIETGGDIRTNDVMTKDLTRIVEEHFFNYRKYEQTINLGGKEVRDLAVRIPMMASTRAHMASTDLLAQSASQSIIDNLRMSVSIDYERNARFGLGALDAAMLSPAWGGSDWDDSLYIVHRYDSKAKRLLAMVYRDPNAIGEYAIMDADITLDKNFSKYVVDGESVQDLAIEQKKIREKLAKAGRKVDKMSDGQLRKYDGDIRRLNYLNERLDKFYSTAEEITSIDVGRMFSLDPDIQTYEKVYAPNGSVVTEDGLKRWREISHLRGYGQADASTAQVLKNIAKELSDEQAGRLRLPFEFVTGYKDYLETGFFKAVGEEFKDTSTGRMTQEAIKVRSEAIARSQNALGKGVNVATIVENFVGAYSTTQYGLSKEQVDIVHRVLKANQLNVIDREIFIDAAVKTSDEELMRMAQKATDENLEKLGQIIGRLHQEGISDAGLDPALFEQRLAPADQRNLIVKGYKSVVTSTQTMESERIIEKFLMSVDNPRAFYTDLYGKIIDIHEGFLGQRADLVAQSQRNLLEELSEVGFEATNVERVRAQEFISDYYRDERAMHRLAGSPDDMERIMRNIMDDVAIDPDIVLGTEDLNLRGLQKFKQWGLFEDERALNRQLNAISQLAVEGALEDPTSGSAALRPLSTISTDSGRTSVNKVALQARRLNREEIAIRQMESLVGSVGTDVNVMPLIEDHLPTGRLGKTIVGDTIARDKRLAKTLINMAQAGGINYQKPLMETLTRLGVDPAAPTWESHLDAIDAIPDRVDGMMWQDGGLNIPDDPGAKRLAAREWADQAAEQVLYPKGKTQKRINMAMISDLLSKPGFRKGLGAAALFAGLGIVHGMRGDRSVEDMSGPPMLPGGSAYEDYPSQGVDMSSIYSTINSPDFGQQGFTYKINASGAFDPNELKMSIGGIINAPTQSTIYQSRPGHPQRPSSSMQALNSIYG